MRTRVLVTVIGFVGTFGVAAAMAATIFMSWGKAIEVPGTAALNTGGTAVVNSVSCYSEGKCSAAGYYTDQSQKNQAFVIDAKKSVWGTAIRVPGTEALSNGGGSVVNSVSCGGLGNCAAGGSYYNSTSEAFVANEKQGAWGDAIEVPGTAALDTNGSAGVEVVSCASSNNCSAGGYYFSPLGYQAFVVDETNGTWGTAMEVPGTAALNTGGNDFLTSLSCSSVGNCAAGGWYLDGNGYEAFVVDETNGTWGTAIEVPGIAALNSGGYSAVKAISCASTGNCVAGGYYNDGGYQAFVVREKNGLWGTAVKVRGTPALNVGGDAQVSAISCAGPEMCTAGGHYSDSNHNVQAFVVTYKNGVWQRAIELPGTAAFQANYATVTSMSCSSAGNCVAGGTVLGGGARQAFVASQEGGTWNDAVTVPGSVALNAGGAAATISVSCADTGRCVLGGVYTDAQGAYQAFVTQP